MQSATLGLVRVRNPFPRYFLRSYAGLAYNANPSGTEDKGKTASKNDDGSSTISSLSPGINTAANWIQHPIPDPAFEVISAGTPGALLYVKIPPRSEIYATPATVIAASGKVRTERSTDGNIIMAMGRKLAGGLLVYHKLITDAYSGDALLAPSPLSDIAAIQMDGRSDYYVRKGAFFAKGPRVSLKVERIRGMGALNKFAYRISGRGTLVISGHGSIHRLVLNAGDEYLVNPKHLVAWDAFTYPIISSPLVGRSGHTRLKFLSNKMANLVPQRASTFIENVKMSPSVKSTLDRIRRMTVRTRKWALGGPEYLKLSGPGDFYIASRVEPVLLGLKSLTSPTIEELEATDVPFTPPASRIQQAPTPPTISYAEVTNGTVNFFPTSSALSPTPSKPKTRIGRISGLLQLRKIFGGW
ncbi:5262_t:CDS:2 [Paraglomus occultum]|uniref:Altered inheritance of mitochondria protein 24, mitochondrial n=1 Tax=Paraglomus occultum TaxID=144539 RepID=A0A9N8VHK6_9GLOM|nr:5262_t:CDS:2 [Paraglomus occultum]